MFMLNRINFACQRCQSKLQNLAHFALQAEDFATPVITVPVKMNRLFLKKRTNKEKKIINKGKLLVVARPGKLLISCSDRQFNMYTNVFPTKFEPPSLASSSWTGRKSPGKHFTIHATRKNPALTVNETFENLGFSETLLKALKQLGLENATKIQTQGIPYIFQGENVIFTAETGSGKTYTYLLPIMDNFLRSKSYKCIPGCPSAIILVPTKELSLQVEGMATQLNLPLNVNSLDNPESKKAWNNGAMNDIVITTPVLLLSYLKQRKLTMNSVKYIVVDECDTLLDKSFSPLICNILNRINIDNGKLQPLGKEQMSKLILCSATFPEYAENTLYDIISFENITSLITGYTHRLQPHITHKFLRCKPSQKFETLVEILKTSINNYEPSIIFCNKLSTCKWLISELTAFGLNAKAIHGKLNSEDRHLSLVSFYGNECNILVTTDICSRGINSKNVKNVINYDFPSAVSDYIHRSGRCGRVDQEHTGCVISLICRKWEIPLVNQLEEAARRRSQIEGVNADIKTTLQQRWEDKTFSSLEETP